MTSSLMACVRGGAWASLLALMFIDVLMFTKDRSYT